jgi:hypothetical protein
MTYQVTGLTFGFLCCPTLTQCVADSEGRRQGRSQELRIFTQATRLHGKISKTANFWGQFLFVGKIKTCLLSLINISPNHQPWHVFDMLHWISYQLSNLWGCWSESLKSIDYQSPSRSFTLLNHQLCLLALGESGGISGTLCPISR